MKKILKVILFLATFLIFLLILLLGLYKLMNATTFQIGGNIVNHIDTEEKVVALTFDDGPNEHTDEILKILEEKNVLATFFLIGNQIEKYPEQTKKIQEAGHQIGNHSYSHSRMIFKSPQFIQSEIEKTNTLITDAGYTGEILFRPPYGKKLLFLPLYLNSQNMKTIMWNLDPLQSLPANAASQEISTYVRDHTVSGSIILIHPWYGEENNARKAISTIIDMLREDGYGFVTVSDLLTK